MNEFDYIKHLEYEDLENTSNAKITDIKSEIMLYCSIVGTEWILIVLAVFYVQSRTLFDVFALVKENAFDSILIIVVIWIALSYIKVLMRRVQDNVKIEKRQVVFLIIVTYSFYFLFLILIEVFKIVREGIIIL